MGAAANDDTQMDSKNPDRRLAHLYAAPVRESLDLAGYGSWRAISAPDAVSLSFGFPFPDSFPTDELDAATETVLAEEGSRALQYGGGEYASHLPEFAAKRARERGMSVTTADEVVLTNGAAHATDVVAHTFLDPGDEVVLEAPTYMGTLKLLQNYGVDVTGIPVDDDGMVVSALADYLADSRAAGEAMPKLVYTIPDFQNPAGTTLSRERRRRLLELAAEYDFVVMEDDPYGELHYADEPEPPLRALDDDGRVVRITTVSKTIAPGVRTGWIVADDEVADELGRMAVGGSNAFTRSVVGRYCKAGYFEEHVAELRERYAERRDHMLACLDRHMPADARWTEPDGGFFVWVTLPDGLSADEVLPTAADEGVTYLPGSMFYPDRETSDDLRLSFSYVSPEEMDEGVAALARALDNERGD